MGKYKKQRKKQPKWTPQKTNNPLLTPPINSHRNRPQLFSVPTTPSLSLYKTKQKQKLKQIRESERESENRGRSALKREIPSDTALSFLCSSFFVCFCFLLRSMLTAVPIYPFRVTMLLLLLLVWLIESEKFQLGSPLSLLMSWEMGSRLATTEKRPTKSRGRLGSVFFHFFDWNRMLSKKKKKLFSSNKLLLPSGACLRLTHLILSIKNEEILIFYFILFFSVEEVWWGWEDAQVQAFSGIFFSLWYLFHFYSQMGVLFKIADEMQSTNEPIFFCCDFYWFLYEL